EPRLTPPRPNLARDPRPHEQAEQGARAAEQPGAHHGAARGAPDAVHGAAAGDRGGGGPGAARGREQGVGGGPEGGRGRWPLGGGARGGAKHGTEGEQAGSERGQAHQGSSRVVGLSVAPGAARVNSSTSSRTWGAG